METNSITLSTGSITLDNQQFVPAQNVAWGINEYLPSYEQQHIWNGIDWSKLTSIPQKEADKLKEAFLAELSSDEAFLILLNVMSQHTDDFPLYIQLLLKGIMSKPEVMDELVMRGLG